MQFDEAVAYLLSLGHETLAMKLGLANVARLLAALDQPQRAYPAVQIAGTNGKGSTAALLDAIARAAGLRTGLYTSPHLVAITERIKINGRELAPEEFARFATEVHAAAEQLHTETGARPTFFEQVTAIALVAFRAAQVQLAILETGLGGRLDATTAARADTLALTPIALDHQAYLGHTLTEIAAEKAAIIRPHTSVVVASQMPAARAVILARCRACNVTPRFVDEDVQVLATTADGRLRATFHTAQTVYADVPLALRGRHQLTNASVAIALAETLRTRDFNIPSAAISAGLRTAVHPGRLELQTGTPVLLFDGAHNPAGAIALRAYLDEFVHAPITLLFGAMSDKELDQLVAALCPVAARVILTQPTNPRAATLDMLKASAQPYTDAHRLELAATPSAALRRAFEVTPPDGLVCVTGSLYLIGEIKQLLADKPHGRSL